MSEEKTNPGSAPAPTSNVKAVASAPSVAIPGASPEVADFIKLLLAREAREAQIAQSKAEAEAIRNARREKNASQTHGQDLMKQARCKHRKGGRLLSKAPADFTISLHTFISQEKVIRCHICSMKWKEQDTSEWLIRSGHKIKNHTRIGWDQAMSMVAQGTNTPTTSEIPISGSPVGNLGETETGEIVRYEL